MNMRTTRDNGGDWRRGVNLAALEREVGEYVDEARGRASQLHAPFRATCLTTAWVNSTPCCVASPMVI